MISLKATRSGMEAASQKFADMIAGMKDLRPFMDAAADYMVRSTKWRIRQGWQQPDGRAPPALAELTRVLKGHNKPWYDEGRLYRGIEKDRVTADGFVIRVEARNDKGYDYAPNVQFGNRKQGGIVAVPGGGYVRPKKPAPARPFLGFSDENIARLSKLLRQHVLKT